MNFFDILLAKKEAGGGGDAAVDVAVPNSYAAADEGKVVSNGALVSQTAHAQVTANGTYDTTLNDSIEVAVSGSGTPVYSGTYTPAENTTGPSFDVGHAVTHFLIFPTANMWGTQSLKMFWGAYTEFGTTMVFNATSNNAGAASVARYHQDSWFSISGTVVTCTNTGTSGVGHAGYFAAGTTYKWYAW